jgi:hypothetical protein
MTILMRRTVRLPLGNRVTFALDDVAGALAWEEGKRKLADSPHGAQKLAACYTLARDRFFAEAANVTGKRIAIGERVFVPRGR